MIRIGYACINLELRKQDIYSTRTITLGQIAKRGLDVVKQIALQNIHDLGEIIKQNEKNGIRFFRITSNLFPHLENPHLENQLGGQHQSEKYNIDFARDELARVGALAREYGHRLTMHPGQYVQLGSPKPEVVKQSIRDITIHAKILQAMGMKPELGSVIIIHGGGRFGDKPATLNRIRETFKLIPSDISQFIAFENDEWSYSVMDLLPLCEELNIPLVPDFFHHKIGFADQFNIYDPQIIKRIILTWTKRGIKPKCHYSEQRMKITDGIVISDRKGAHSDCVDELPRELIRVAKENDMDIMLEVKHKDTCALEIYKKYFQRVVSPEGRVEWYLL